MDIYERVGSRIREARVKKDIPAKQMADVLDCSLASISNYEKAKRWISLVDLERAAEFLGEPLSYFIEENPSEKRSLPPHTFAERKILNAIKGLQESDLKNLPEKATSVLQKSLEAKYTILFLINENKEFELTSFSGIKTGLLKKLEDLLSLNVTNLSPEAIPARPAGGRQGGKFKLSYKLQTVFDVNKPYLSTNIASSFSQFGAKRLSLLAPSLIDLAKFEAVLLLPLKTNHSPAGLFIACFEKIREAERWKNSELLVFFTQYAAQVLENARLLEVVHRKEQKPPPRSSIKIEVEGQVPQAAEKPQELLSDRQ